MFLPMLLQDTDSEESAFELHTVPDLRVVRGIQPPDLGDHGRSKLLVEGVGVLDLAERRGEERRGLVAHEGKKVGRLEGEESYASRVEIALDT